MASISAATAIPASASSVQEDDRIEPRRLIAFLAMVFGMFMAILDIQIVSASLTEIQAGLAASANEITWVQTAYLISEVVMIPLSGYLSRAMGTRLLFAISAGGFTAASLMCGLSTSINEMIVWRAIQGFIGGGMIPTVFATAYIIFPRSRMGLVAPMIGLVATLAPTIGPTVGGYLTDALSWHWLFFINIVPGTCRHRRRADPHRFRQAGLVAVSQLRLDRAAVHGRLPRRARIRARGGPAQRLVRRRYRAADGVGVGPVGDRLLRARADGQVPDRRPARVQGPQFRARQPVLLRARHRPLRPHLSLPRLPRADPRPQRADDRRDLVRVGRRSCS